jgi:bifunctional non-homologous end joining protein LigD
VHWLKPKLVCRVKFSEWTSDGKLRAPVYLGLRDDVKPTDCVREEKSATHAVPDTKTVKNPLKNSTAKKSELAKDTGAQSESESTDPVSLVSHPEKVYFPEDGITKGDVARYYYDVADVILPHLKGRPLSLKRYPGGINTKPFFQKHVRAGIPPSMVAKGEDGEEYIVCNTRDDLVFLANLGCIDQNPWMSRIGSLDSPDYILVDLDPFECAFSKVIEAAIEVRNILEKCGLRAFPKTTGGDGLHIFIPLNRTYTYDDARMFAEVLSLTAAQQKPALFTVGRAIASRIKDRVYFDYLQIGRGKTIASAYSLRAYPHAPVSMPLDWEELTPKLTPTTFTIKNARERIAKRGDSFADVLTLKQSLTKPLAVLRKMYEADKA